MPRKKKVEEMEEVVVEKPKRKVKPVVKEPTMPTFEGAQVVAVLEDGHTKTHLHCRMADKTTKHLPRTLFV